MEKEYSTNGWNSSRRSWCCGCCCCTRIILSCPRNSAAAAAAALASICPARESNVPLHIVGAKTSGSGSSLGYFPKGGSRSVPLSAAACDGSDSSDCDKSSENDHVSDAEEVWHRDEADWEECEKRGDDDVEQELTARKRDSLRKRGIKKAKASCGQVRYFPN
eukprot:6202993-Pleurochrysis_carterae.AAC.4